MARRPALRKSDLSAALSCLRESGIKPRRIKFTHDGFELDLDEDDAASLSELDRELADFEAKHGGC